ncbi:MAG: PAS domain S-box protein [Gallionella sp.]|jgi:PAS domain S-box-containing protein|nr:PAS domain S-box protein [Gallionella sp.]MCK9353018.1 PAS domain S-box protein [Gallionella sp.]
MALPDVKHGKLRVLNLEDSPNDSELIQAELETAWDEVDLLRVETRDAFVRALDEFAPDVVLSDFNLPDMSGKDALHIVRQSRPDIPVVMVTGALGDIEAVELVKLGARDYVMKDHLQRLTSAVQGALSLEQGIRARKAAEKSLRQSEEEIRELVERSPIAMIVDVGTAADEKVIILNRHFTELFGYTIDDVPDITQWWRQAYPDEQYREEVRNEWTGRVGNAVREHGAIEPMESTVTCKDGSQRYVRVSFSSIGSRNIVTFVDLTERRILEEALKEAADRNRAITETANDAIICIDPAGNVYLWNRKAEEMFGYSAAEAVGRSLHELIMPPQYGEQAAQAMRHFAQTGSGPIVGTTRQLTARRKDGSEFSVELSVSAMSLHGEWHATGIIRDITERKQAEAKIERLNRLYEALSQCNLAIVRSTSEAELFGQICQSVVRFGGFGMAWIGLLDPVTQMVKPEASSGEAAEEYLRGIEISADADSEHGWDPTGTAIRENRPCWSQDFLNSPGNVSWREHAAASGWRSSAALPLHREGRVVGAFNLYSDVMNAFDQDVRDLLDEMAADISYALDYFGHEAKRKRAEDELRKLSLAVEQSPSSIVITDLDARIEYINEAFVKATGYSREEAIGQNPRILHSGKTSSATYDEMWAHLTRGETWKGELINQRKDGSEYVESILLSPVRDAEGRTSHYLGIKEDITERKRAEAQIVAQLEHLTAVNAQLVEANTQLEQARSQLLQSEKMAAIGLLAAGVAHEINNPVGYVNSNLGTLEKYLADIFVVIDKYEAAEAVQGKDNPLLDELRQFKTRSDFNFLRQDIKSLIAESHQGLERIKKIIRDLKDFSRSDVDEQWVWADVHHGLDTTLNVVWNELKYKCEVVKEYGDLPDIWCLPSQLNQVFMNLLVNAAQAIEVRGTITIRTGAEGERVWVEISDSGYGIPPEIIPRLFDPFFTTKPVGLGTGLGLSVSYKIVEKHHGKIEVRSELGKGATFRVWLPVQSSTEKIMTV